MLLQPTPSINPEKRAPGSLTQDNLWRVLTESTQNADGTWKHRCGEGIWSLTVLLSVHDGPFPLSGWGQVKHEQVPYCPSCELRPLRTGFLTPIPGTRRMAMLISPDPNQSSEG